MPDKQAAGIAFMAPGGEVLFLKRGGQGDHEGTWCFPGGHIEEGEAAVEAAKREAVEELGILPPGEPRRLARLTSEDGVIFTTFEQDIDAMFVPTLNYEHTAFAWAQPNDPPQPVHPGIVAMFNDLRSFSFDPENIEVISRGNAVGREVDPYSGPGTAEMDDDVDVKETVHLYEQPDDEG